MPHHTTNSLLLALAAAVPVGVSSFPLPNPIPYANITIPHQPHDLLHTRETEWQRYKAKHPKPPRPQYTGSVLCTPVSPPKPAPAKEEPRHCRGKNNKPPCHPYTPNRANAKWKYRALLGAFILLGIGAGTWGTHHNGKETLALPTMVMPTETGAGLNMGVLDREEADKWLGAVEFGIEAGEGGTGEEGKIWWAYPGVGEGENRVVGPPKFVQEEGDKERVGYVFRGDEGGYITTPAPGERVYSEEEVNAIIRAAGVRNGFSSDAKVPVEKVEGEQAGKSEGDSGEANDGSTSDSSWTSFPNPPPHAGIPKANLAHWVVSDGDSMSANDGSTSGSSWVPFPNPPPPPTIPNAALADWKTSKGDSLSVNDGSAQDTGFRATLPEMQGSGSTHDKSKGDPSFKDASIWYGKGLDDTVPVEWEWVKLGETSKGDSMSVIDESTADGSTSEFSWKGVNPPPTPKMPKAVLADYKVSEGGSMSVNDGSVRGGSASEADSMSAIYGGTSQFSWKGVNPPPPPQPAKAVLAEWKASEGGTMSIKDGSRSSDFTWRGVKPPPHLGLPELEANQEGLASEGDSMSVNDGTASDSSLKGDNPAPHAEMPKVVHWEVDTGKEVWKDGSGSGSGSDLNSAGTVAHNKLVDGGEEAGKNMAGVVHWGKPEVIVLDSESDCSDVSSSANGGRDEATPGNHGSPPPSFGSSLSSSGNDGGDGAASEDSSSSGSSFGFADAVDNIVAWG